MASKDKYNIFLHNKKGITQFISTVEAEDAKEAFFKGFNLQPESLSNGYKVEIEKPYLRISHGDEAYSVYKRERR